MLGVLCAEEVAEEKEKSEAQRRFSQVSLGGGVSVCFRALASNQKYSASASAWLLSFTRSIPKPNNPLI